MPVQPLNPDVLAAAFTNLGGFDFINAGSYKSVYRVTRADGVCEVLKVVRLPLEGATEEAIALRRQELGRAQREVSLLRDCQSPFVVKLGSVAPAIRELGGDDCVVYTEEHLPGSELLKVIDRSNLPSAEQIKRLLSCLVQAVRALWTQQSTVHRDIKPGNIMATGLADRPYVLLDLGIAYNVREPGLTAKPEFIPATPRYMAPEMLDPNFRENLSYRADLYAAGVTAFEFATGGTHPLARTADDMVQTITRILHQEPRRLFATLAVATDALRDRIELQNFLQEITELENPPSGIYLLIEHPDHDISPTLEESDVLSRWMLINRVLSLSGFQVINGYADVIAPYLGAAGATSVASGWFNTLKVFSLKKYAPNSGMARQPVPRYTSARLLKSIRHTELESLRAEFPGVLNGAPADRYYDEDEGSRPSLIGEAMQNWECLRLLSRPVVGGNPEASLAAIETSLDLAEKTYADIAASGLTLRERSNSEHVQYLREELQAFRELAEIPV
jgi:serine/threonine protein kinase